MNHRQRQTEFLRQCLLYDESSERHQLAERIKQVQKNERCVRRAMWLMVLLAALAFAGLAYLAIFLEDFPQNMPGFMTRLVTKILSVLGLGSLICIPAFVGLELVYRKELNERQEECRRLASELLESRLGKPPSRNGTMPETLVRKAESVNHAENNTSLGRSES
jgi:hypothetical protein